MNKQEQIEAMEKIIDELYNVYDTTAGEIAEGLYNAGYRREAELDEEECDVVDDYTIGFATYLMQKRRDEVDRMQSKIKRLEKENANLLKVCEKQFAFDKKYSGEVEE